MKCPSCGFENIPGRTECGVCLATLQAAEGPPSIYPPRARDRTARQRWEWFSYRRVQRSLLMIAVQRAREAAAALRASVQPGFRPIEVAMVLASVVPGMGYLLVWDNRDAARRHLLVALGMLLGAVLLYRLPLADVLLLGILGLSMFSVAVAVEGLRGPASPVLAGRRMTATLLLTLAAYAFTAAVVNVALEPYYMIGQVAQPAPSTSLEVRDRVLFTNGQNIRRGDVVIGYGDNWPGPRLGPVVGLPGETVRVMSDGRVFVDERLTQVRLESFGGSDVGVIRLGSNDVWVPPNVRVVGEVEDLAQQIVVGGLTSRSSVRAAVAVLGPPRHRGRVPRVTIFQEGE